MRLTFRDAVAAYFKAHPGDWLRATSFESVGGRQAWRSRIAECRTQLGMTIENRCRTVTDLSGQRYVISEYKYVPKGQEELPCMHEPAYHNQLG